MWQPSGGITVVNVGERLAELQASKHSAHCVEVIPDDAVDLLSDALPAAEEPEPDEPIQHLYGVFPKSLTAEFLTACRQIKKEIPWAWRRIMQDERLDIILAFDGTARTLFDGRNAKIEQGGAKIYLPGVCNAQQSPYLGIPLCLLEGTTPSRQRL